VDGDGGVARSVLRADGHADTGDVAAASEPARGVQSRRAEGAQAGAAVSGCGGVSDGSVGPLSIRL
jgi:hypothetical protein